MCKNKAGGLIKKCELFVARQPFHINACLKKKRLWQRER